MLDVFREEHIELILPLKGWVSRRRLGWFDFIDLRDREGKPLL